MILANLWSISFIGNGSLLCDEGGGLVAVTKNGSR